MFDFLLLPAFAPFTVALALFLGLFGLELVALFLGGSLTGDSDGVDLDIDAPDFDIDLDLVDADLDFDLDIEVLEGPEIAEPSVADATGSGWLGFGDVPFIIWLASLLLGFGFTGMALQLLANDLFDTTMPVLAATAGAGVLGLGFTRSFARLFARLLPKFETESLSERSLGRRRGIVTQGTATRGRPAEVRVIDGYGNTHYIRAEPLSDGDTITQGNDVIVLRVRGVDGYRIMSLTDV